MASSTSAPYSSGETASTQGAQHRLIWCNRHGRVPVGEHRVRAGAQQESLLQLVQRPVHRACRRERPEILSLLSPRAAMLAHQGPVAGLDQDVRKALVVAQQYIESRLQLLDQVRFKQQRLGLGFGGDELHRGRRRDHPGNAVRVPTELGIRGHALLQRPRLADIQHALIRRDHPVHAGAVIQPRNIGPDDVRPRL